MEASECEREWGSRAPSAVLRHFDVPTLEVLGPSCDVSV